MQINLVEINKEINLKYDSLSNNEITIWLADASEWSSDYINYMSNNLSDHERQRANKFVHNILVRRYILARSILRLILASYLNISPKKINISYGKHGKPNLITHKEKIVFNVSHCDNVVAIAVARIGMLGVDIERVRFVENIDDIVIRNFSIEETKYYFSMPVQDRVEAFYRLWTIKESFVKALGCGLAMPLNEINFNTEYAEDSKIHGFIYKNGRWEINWRRLTKGIHLALAYRNNEIGNIDPYN